MDKRTITNHQFFSLVACYTCGTSIIMASAGPTGIAKQDAWISAILTPLFGLFFIWLYSYLGRLFPEKTFVEIICLVLGKPLGYFTSASFVFLCFLNVPQIIWYSGYFLKTEVLTETPLYAVTGAMIIVLVIALSYGIEAIARSSEISFYFVTGVLILVFLLVIPNAKAERLLPVLENGITPVLKGSLLLSSYTTLPLIILMMIFPSHVNNIKSARKAFYNGYLWGSSIILTCTILAILVLGSTISAKSQFPTYLLAKETSIGSTRLEAVIASVWLITLFFKALLYFYGGVISLSQLIGLKDYRKILLPLGLIALIYTDVVYPNSNYEAEWDTTIWLAYIPTFAVALPLILLLVYMIKKWLRRKSKI